MRRFCIRLLFSFCSRLVKVLWIAPSLSRITIQCRYFAFRGAGKFRVLASCSARPSLLRCNGWAQRLRCPSRNRWARRRPLAVDREGFDIGPWRHGYPLPGSISGGEVWVSDLAALPKPYVWPHAYGRRYPRTWNEVWPAVGNRNCSNCPGKSMTRSELLRGCRFLRTSISSFPRPESHHTGVLSYRFAHTMLAVIHGPFGCAALSSSSFPHRGHLCENLNLSTALPNLAGVSRRSALGGSGITPDIHGLPPCPQRAALPLVKHSCLEATLGSRPSMRIGYGENGLLRAAPRPPSQSCRKHNRLPAPWQLERF